MGTPAFAVPVLERLLGAGHEVVGVYTQPDKPAGRGKHTQPTPVKAFAEQHGLPVFQPRSLRSAEAQAELAALDADAAVVAAYGNLLPKAVLEAPRLGCLNIHPSLLPRHRGASPVASAILEGDAMTGVTVMLLDEGMDTGPLIAQRITPIGPGETAADLTRRLFEAGAELLVEVITDLNAGRIVPKPQDESEATLSRRLTRDDGRIDWSRSAKHIARMVRAYDPWPGAFTVWADKTVKILEAVEAPGNGGAPGTVTVADGDVAVVTGDGTLVIARLQQEGRRSVSATEFIAGHPALAGTKLG